ncbi:MFS general substrate transporter [Ramaria rubella]|nr:MFS general substrate transporter [Ramaria rubella]
MSLTAHVAQPTCTSLAPGATLESVSSLPSAVAASSVRLKRDETNELTLSDVEALLPRLPPTPIPKLQLAVLCLARFADPITFTQIFPYVNEMIEDIGIANTPSQVGFYSGIVESVFAISQLLAILPCARLSDAIGRRPVILIGVVGLALATFAFGISKTFMAILITRCLAGALAGNVATIHAVLAEITDASNHAVALPVYGLSWPIGSIVGPLIGGTFSHPARHFSMFESFPLFRTYPYFLPCLISGAMALGGSVLGYFCLEETLPNKRRALIDAGSPSERIDTTKAYGTVNRTNAHQITPKPEFATTGMQTDMHTESDTSMFGLLAIPVVRALAISSFALSFLSGGFDVLFVLFCYSSISAGGLGYSASQIGYALAIAGTSAVLFQAFALPTLLRHVTALTAYKLCMTLWSIAYVALPLLNVLARLGLDDINAEADALKPAYSIAVWIGIGICLAITRLANLAFSLSMILVKDTSPCPSALGAANALAQFSMCLARAIAPAFVSALFATSIDHHILGSYLWVCVMGFLAWAGIRVTDWIKLSHDKPFSSKTI